MKYFLPLMILIFSLNVNAETCTPDKENEGFQKDAVVSDQPIKRTLTITFCSNNVQTGGEPSFVPGDYICHRSDGDWINIGDGSTMNIWNDLGFVNCEQTCN